MSKPRTRHIAVPVTSAAVVAGMMFTAAPAGAAVATTNFTSACVAASIIGDQQQTVAASMTVDAPDSVEAGEVFTYRIQPNASSYPDKQSIATTTNLSRLKYDYELPDNTEWVSGAVVPGTAVGLDNVAPNVLLVNDSGNVDPNGRVIRLSGNNEVAGNGPTTSTNSEGGIRVPKTKKNLDGTTNSSGATWFQLPAIDVTVRAVAPGVITPRVRIAGNAANHGAYEGFSTSLAKASALGGTQWAPTRCTPRDNKDAPLNAGAGPLATITVGEPGPTIVDTTTTLNAPATAKTGVAVDLTATVAPAGATGTVEFKDGDTVLGSAPVAGGAATLSHTFATAGTHSVTAAYSGDATNNPSTSTASTIEVSVNILDTTTTVNVPGEATTGAAVDLWALVNGPDNTPAAGGTVQFQDNGSDIGSPVALVDGGAKLTHTFTGAGSHAITAIYSGAEGFGASTGAAQTVNVTDPAPVEVATATTLEVPATATKGDAVSLTATVKTESGEDVTTGTVRFFDGATPIGEAVDVVNGKAVLSYAFGELGAREITAVYTGSTGFLESTSAASTVTVNDVSGPGGVFGSLENIFGS